MGLRFVDDLQGFAAIGIAGEELLQKVLPLVAELAAGYGDGVSRAARADLRFVKTVAASLRFPMDTLQVGGDRSPRDRARFGNGPTAGGDGTPGSPPAGPPAPGAPRARGRPAPPDPGIADADSRDALPEAVPPRPCCNHGLGGRCPFGIFFIISPIFPMPITSWMLLTFL